MWFIFRGNITVLLSPHRRFSVVRLPSRHSCTRRRANPPGLAAYIEPPPKQEPARLTDAPLLAPQSTARRRLGGAPVSRSAAFSSRSRGMAPALSTLMRYAPGGAGRKKKAMSETRIEEPSIMRFLLANADHITRFTITIEGHYVARIESGDTEVTFGEIKQVMQYVDLLMSLPR